MLLARWLAPVANHFFFSFQELFYVLRVLPGGYTSSWYEECTHACCISPSACDDTPGISSQPQSSGRRTLYFIIIVVFAIRQCVISIAWASTLITHMHSRRKKRSTYGWCSSFRGLLTCMDGYLLGLRIGAKLSFEFKSFSAKPNNGTY